MALIKLDYDPETGWLTYPDGERITSWLGLNLDRVKLDQPSKSELTAEIEELAVQPAKITTKQLVELKEAGYTVDEIVIFKEAGYI